MTYMGPLGNMVRFKCPVSMDAPYERPNSQAVTIGGVRHTQRAPRSLRSWSMQIELATAEDLANLIALEQGVYGPAPWQLYDEVAAYTNMLIPEAAAPGIPAGIGWETGTPGEPIDAPFPNVLAVDSAAVEALSHHAPVVPGKTYTGAARMLDRPGGTSTGTLYLDFLDENLQLIQTDNSGSVVSPDRATVTAVAPSNAAAVRLRVAVSGTIGWFGSFQVTQSSEATAWHPGMGVSGVSIPGGFEQNYIDMFGSGRGTRRNIQITILEVGSAT